jgi:hypothetical protein
LTNAVQTLAGVLLPSASVFLLLLCNDRAVLGPWAKSRNLNLFTGVVVAALVMLSLILTLSVLFTGITESQLLAIFIGGCIAAAVAAIGSALPYRHARRRRPRRRRARRSLRIASIGACRRSMNSRRHSSQSSMSFG